MRKQDVWKLSKNVAMGAVIPYLANGWLAFRLGEIVFSLPASTKLNPVGEKALESFFSVIGSWSFLILYALVMLIAWFLAFRRLDHKPYQTTAIATLARNWSSPLCRFSRFLSGVFIPPFSIMVGAKVATPTIFSGAFDNYGLVLVLICVVGIISQFMAEWHDIQEAVRLRPGAVEYLKT